jgi:nicotinamidase-related amidase
MEAKKALIIIDIQNDYFEGGANPLSGSNERNWDIGTFLVQSHYLPQ